MSKPRKLKKPTKRPAKAKASRKARPLRDAPTKPKKKAVRKARPLVAEKHHYHVRNSELRKMGALDYITDPQGRTAEYWHGREDRPYGRAVPLGTFQQWCKMGGWVAQRKGYHEEIHRRVMESKLLRDVEMRRREVERLTEDQALLMEFLSPLRDSKGEVRRYVEGPYEGLPMLPGAPPSFEKMVKSYVELSKHLLLLRGEATSRTDVTTETRVTVDALADPLVEKVQLAREDIRALGQALLERRQPELIESSGREIEESSDGE